MSSLAIKSVAAAALAFGLHLDIAATKDGPSSPALRLPAELGDYRTWTRATKEPHAVGFQLSRLCRSPTPQEWEEVRKSVGPHMQRYVHVYANPVAAETLMGRVRGPFPVGSILAKEKLVLPDSSHPEGIGFMVKRSGSSFRSTGGWEFLFFPEKGDRTVTHAACAACHIGSKRDYVMGVYGK